MSVNVKLGNNTINNVDSVKLKDATNNSLYHTFSLATPINCASTYSDNIGVSVMKFGQSTGTQISGTMNIQWTRITDSGSPLLPLFIDEDGNVLDIVYVSYTSSTGTSTLSGTFTLTPNDTATTINLSNSRDLSSGGMIGLDIHLYFYKDSARTERAYVITNRFSYDLGTMVGETIAQDELSFYLSSFTTNKTLQGNYTYSVTFRGGYCLAKAIELSTDYYYNYGDNGVSSTYSMPMVVGMHRYDND